MPAMWQCSASSLTQGVAVVQRIAEFTARCEKYVGTESGGMDQAISIMGDKGLAKLVHFKPVRLQCAGARLTVWHVPLEQSKPVSSRR